MSEPLTFNPEKWQPRVVLIGLVLINKVTLHRVRLFNWMGDCLLTGKPSQYVTNY